MPARLKDRASHHSVAEHRAFVEGALQNFDQNPYRVLWHYMQASFKRHGLNLSEAADSMKMHRRTLQRKLGKREPKP